MSFRRPAAATLRPPARPRVWPKPAKLVALAVMLTACSVSDVMRPDVDVGMRTAAVAPSVGLQTLAPAVDLQTLAPSDPVLAGYPRPETPAAPPQSVMPADEVDCRRQLKKLGVRFRDVAPIRDSASCGIDWPVEVSGFSGSVGLKPAATLTCQMALAFGNWTRDELAPAARWRYFSGVKTIHQGSSYSCRSIAGSRTVSEHATGNALDVMRIELKNGTDIDVRKPGWFAFRQRGLLNNVRSDACGYFSTVLGPGYNADHADHFHFDIKERRSGHRACK